MELAAVGSLVLWFWVGKVREEGYSGFGMVVVKVVGIRDLTSTS